MAVARDQVVGRHLEAVPGDGGDDRLGLAGIHVALDDDVARQNQALEARVVAQLLQAMLDELIDVAMVVGEQDPGLHVTPVAAGVVDDAAQREIGAGGVEQRQRQRIDALPVIVAVGDVIVGRGEIGAGEDPCQLGGGHATAGQFVALLHHIGIGDVLATATDLDLEVVVAHQGFELLQQIAAEGRRMGHGGHIGARQLDLGVGAGGGRRHAGRAVADADLGIAEQLALGGAGLDAILEIALERGIQGLGSLQVQRRETVDRLAGRGNRGEILGYGGHAGFLVGTLAIADTLTPLGDNGCDRS